MNVAQAINVVQLIGFFKFKRKIPDIRFFFFLFPPTSNAELKLCFFKNKLNIPDSIDLWVNNTLSVESSLLNVQIKRVGFLKRVV